VTTTANDFDYSSPTVPDAALFVAADEPLLVFPSARAAEQYLEAIDVDNGVYPAAYGPRGEPYRILSAGKGVLIEGTGEPYKPDELKALLVRYLAGSHGSADGTASLESLVARVWKIESEFWQEHDPYGDRFGSRIPVWGCLAIVLGLAMVLYIALG
jgi:hypothetical protein